MKSQKRNMPTITASVTRKQRKWVEQKARKHKVSISRLIRDALERAMNPDGLSA